MNGDLKTIYDEIKELRQDLNNKHEENIKTFGNLPCKDHAVKINTLWLVFLSGFVLTVLGVFIRKVLAG